MINSFNILGIIKHYCTGTEMCGTEIGASSGLYLRRHESTSACGKTTQKYNVDRQRWRLTIGGFLIFFLGVPKDGYRL